jgi:hypothetical protein
MFERRTIEAGDADVGGCAGLQPMTVRFLFWSCEFRAINRDLAVAVQSQRELLGEKEGRRTRLWRCAAALDAEMYRC